MTAMFTAIGTSAALSYYGTKKAGEAQSSASSKSMKAQLAANAKNLEFQKWLYEDQKAQNAPWREMGDRALKQIDAGINVNVESDPGYRFRMSEGINALDASAAARGRLLSGAQQKAVTRFGQETGSQEYGNAYNRELNRLNALVTAGKEGRQADAVNTATYGDNFSKSTLSDGSAISDNAINQGNAQASAYQGYAQVANQGIQNALLYSAIKTAPSKTNAATPYKPNAAQIYQDNADNAATPYNKYAY